MTGDQRIPRAIGAPPDAAGSNPAPHHDKALLRNTLKALRRAIDPATRHAWDDRIGARVLAWWQAHPHESLGVYWPLVGEPDLRPAYAELAHAGVRLALPVVVERDAPLGFAEWIPGEPTVTDRLGVAVPAELRMVARPPALLVPCLGFNASGYRVGYGGGFYDRTLAPEPRPATVGIAYACQLVAFDGDAHDVPLDSVITEE
ncbi:5-formyltetrahydrofolate cyclo-ligase [Massilia oculi]|jgi:5,10-methenyltetrahydrofolate synthetase|uniref:5-formyltetrahydrofolate cyclo-ligase n=1 Tax=Massilia oculi TaxID=945844 RepID=A0A2S2DII8_9BURK|nr:5-formyltetrahydrofolate cyclo-ligase [Massilia oculi]AWL05165.1 5-formyltetrahydrofolate cyclo-ligase [Massilia oculi]